MTRERERLHGGCRCGGLRVAFGTAQDPAALRPRACDCTFCRGHGAAWVSDPAGTLDLTETTAAALREVRQGSESARFVLCARCGVLVCVLFDADGDVLGAVNAACLAARDRLGPAQPASPQLLSAEERRERWKTLWIRGVRVACATA